MPEIHFLNMHRFPQCTPLILLCKINIFQTKFDKFAAKFHKFRIPKQVYWGHCVQVKKVSL